MTPVERVARYIAAHEGGIADVGDGKGTTYFGQTMAWLQDWDLPVPHTPEQAISNTQTWLYKTGLARIAQGDWALGAQLATFAFHAGHKTAIKAVQRRLGVRADGVTGPVTDAALHQHDLLQLRTWVAAEYSRYLLHTMKSKKRDNRKYGGGWGDRAADVIDLIAAPE